MIKNKKIINRAFFSLLFILAFCLYLSPNPVLAVHGFIFSISDSAGQYAEVNSTTTGTYSGTLFLKAPITLRIEPIESLSNTEVHKKSGSSLWSGTEVLGATPYWNVSFPPGNYDISAGIAPINGAVDAIAEFSSVAVQPAMYAVASCSPAQVTLNWDAVPGSGSIYYNIVRDGVTIQTSGTSYIDNGAFGPLNVNTTYTYSVSAIQNSSYMPNMTASATVTTGNCTSPQPATVTINNGSCPLGTVWNSSTGNSGTTTNTPGSFSFTPASAGTAVSIGATPPSGWLFDGASPSSQLVYPGGSANFSLNCEPAVSPTCAVINFDYQPRGTPNLPNGGSTTLYYSAQNCTRGTLSGGIYGAFPNTALASNGYSSTGNNSPTGSLSSSTGYVYRVCRDNPDGEQCDAQSFTVPVDPPNACYPITPNPAGYGNACSSSANACGQTQSNGTIQCNGSCSSTPPANPAGYGTSCSSSPNSCGQTNAGTIQCDGSCSATTPPNSNCAAALPTITTSAVSGITQSSATSGGNISSNGGATVTQSGVAWSTSANPTTVNNRTTDGWAIGGPWASTMTGLAPSTLYHVRAYATNSVGTAYGADVSFTTSAATTTTGTFSGPASCTISSGQSSCNVSLAWSISNPPASSSNSITYWDLGGGIYPLSGLSGSQSVSVPYGPRVFHLTNSAIPRDFTSPVTVYGNCVSGTAWNGSSCSSSAVNGQCSATAYDCSSGTSANNVDGASAWTWTCNGSNGGSTASCSQTKSSSLPDLIAGAATNNSSYALNTPMTFSSLISNIGNASTGGPFHNIIQISDGSQGSGANITDLTPATMNALAAGASSTTTSPSYTFTDSTKTYSIRACSDKLNRFSVDQATGAVITESNEANNCSSWTDVTIPPSGSSPDLTASSATPTTATINVAQTFSSTISNIGNASTGISFSNFFQSSTASNGGGVVTDYGSASMSALAAGGTGSTTKSLIFSTAGTYSVRACADNTSSAGGGVITESNENNNCGPWANVTVISGAVNGQCSTSHYSCVVGTSVNNINGSSNYTWTCNGSNGGSNASCSEAKPTGTYITATPMTIYPGNSSILEWGSNATLCTGLNFDTNNAHAGTTSVSPIVTTTYTLSCNDSTNASVTVTVKKKPCVREDAPGCLP